MWIRRREVVRFSCIEGCSECCVRREYFPSKKFGKIGVLVLPGERGRIRYLARRNGVRVSILPRIGASGPGGSGPSRIIAYQMMGKDANGDTCPFLDTESGSRTENGGHPCMIYRDRPLACAAYPVIGADPVVLDGKCKFCRECGGADGGLDSEIEALAKIRAGVDAGADTVWRYATGIGEGEDRGAVMSGWVREG